MGSLYFKSNIDLDNLLGGKNSRFKLDKNVYRADDILFGEFISINLKTRKIIHKGFCGLIQEWISKGYLIER